MSKNKEKTNLFRKGFHDLRNASTEKKPDVHSFAIRLEESLLYFPTDPNKKIFFGLINALHKCDKKIEKGLKPDNNQLLNLVAESLCKYVKDPNADIIDEMITSALEISEIPYEVFSVVFGAAFAEKSQIDLGIFRIEKAEARNERLVSEGYPSDSLNHLKFTTPGDIVISTKMKIGEGFFAIEYGRNKFEKFENIVAFLNQNKYSRVDVGVPYRLQSGTIHALGQGGRLSSIHPQGFVWDMPLNDNPDLATVSAQWIWAKFDNPDSSEWDKKILRAVDWIGRASRDTDTTRKFIQYFFSLESLFSRPPDNDLTKAGTSHSIAEYCAFVMGESTEERSNIYSALKRHYKSRNDVVHGRLIKSNPEDEIELSDYVHKTIESLISKDEFKSVTDFKAFEKIIEKMKFSIT